MRVRPFAATASATRATWAGEPVRTKRAAKNASSGTTVSATGVPSSSTTDAEPGPCATTFATNVIPTNVARSAAGSCAVATRSTPSTVATMRRTGPATASRSAAGSRWRRPRQRSAAARACETSRRPRARFRKPIPFSTFACVFSPKPLRSRRRFSRHAYSSSARLVTPSCCQISRTRFGPRPSTSSTSPSPGGTAARAPRAARAAPSRRARGRGPRCPRRCP